MLRESNRQNGHNAQKSFQSVPLLKWIILRIRNWLLNRSLILFKIQMENLSFLQAYLLLKVEICKVNLERYRLIRKQAGLARLACRLSPSIDREGVKIFLFQYWWKLLYCRISSSWLWSGWTNLKSFCRIWHQ